MFISVFGDEASYPAKRFFHTYTLQHHLQKLSPTNGAEDILLFCQKQNIRCHIFSNKKDNILKREITALNWQHYFSGISGAGNLIADKPTPDACYEFCKLNNIDTSTLIMIGDGPADTVSARFLNCPIAIICTQECYIGPQPDYTLQNIQEILPLLQTMLY